MSRIAAVIPARWASSRFPGKPLALLHGRPMILHVCDRIAEASRIESFWVVTDDKRILAVVRDAGFEARMTPPECPSGTDRIAASLTAGDPWDILVNVQGDEPCISPSVIDAVAATLENDPGAGVGTAAVPIQSREDFESPHVVKVVLSASGRALYFSRSPLPSTARVDPKAMETGHFEWGLKHLGIYAYRRELLSAYSSWEPTPLEKRECLEQLRFMDRDVPIRVAVVDHDSIGVDTPAELELLNQSS